MAHKFRNLGQNTTFATRREKAWHGLGSVVDSMTSKEAMILGGLDFEVGLAPLYAGLNWLHPEKRQKDIMIRDNNIKLEKLSYYEAKKLNSNFATYRKDNNHIFGVVGSKYEIIQNTEAFDFFDSIIGEGHAEYETVGALGDGETVFITAKLPSKLIVNKEDIDKYLLLTMSHDGTSSIQATFTPIRVVCNNTLTMALGNAPNKVNIRHTKNARTKLEAAKKILGIVENQSKTLEELFQKFSYTRIEDTKTLEIFKKAFNIKVNEETKELSKQSVKKLEELMEYYETGVGQQNIVGTAWGVYNAITGYLQNGIKVKDNNTFFKNSFLGKDDIIRQRALPSLMQLI